LKIAVVRPFFTLRKGGAERYTIELVRALIAQGHSVHVFAWQWDRRDERDHAEEDRVIYVHVPMVRKPSWLRVLSFHWNLRARLRSEDYDVVLGMTPFAPQVIYWLGDGLYRVWTRAAWRPALLRWLICLKRAVMLANLWLERRTLSGGAEHFIANSELVKRQAVAAYQVPPDRISVVYPGVDLKRFNPEVRERWRSEVRKELGIAEDNFLLLFVSNNFARKGLAPLLRAFRWVALRQPKLRLLVVGAGRIRRFKALARWLGVSDRIIFAGASPTIERFYGAADLFVLPTRYDPFAAVCLEAMACGLPVITSSMNGAAEVIEQGKNGFVVGGSRAADLVEPLCSMMEADCLRQMGRAAAETAKSYSHERHTQEMLAILAAVARRLSERKSLQLVAHAPEVVFNKAFLPLLEREKLASYTALLESDRPAAIEYNLGQRIFRFDLPENPNAVGFYLKRFHSRLAPMDWCRRLIGMPVIADGMKEWNSIVALHRRGLPVVTPVAAGQRKTRSVKESFVMTLALDDYLPLDRYLATRFQPPLGAEQLKRKRSLIKKVAAITRQIHWAGFNHRDFYLNHLFVRPSDEDLKIIDLQRMDHRDHWRRRWRIKDLAALHYSSLPLPVSTQDRLRFYAVYSTPAENRRLRQRWLRSVLLKSRSIARHDARLEKLRSKTAPINASFSSR
jgi:UDP-glucose:(heptosyl)LPS alpha-1,3-glucosyltransferase